MMRAVSPGNTLTSRNTTIVRPIRTGIMISSLRRMYLNIAILLSCNFGGHGGEGSAMPMTGPYLSSQTL